MAARTITASNSIVMLSIPGVTVAPQRLQGFAADAMFDTENVEPAETQMGVDGFLSAGYVPVPYKQMYHLQADSASQDLFDQWMAAQKSNREILRCNATITLTGPGKSYAATNGVLTGYPVMADAKKVLQPRTFAITWEDISPAPL